MLQWTLTDAFAASPEGLAPHPPASTLVDGYGARRYGAPMWSLRPSALPSGFIPPRLPTAAPCAPSGDQWWHEIKHDGIRVIARKEDKRIKLYSRPGNDLTHRFPLIVEALEQLRARSCIIDGEAVACGDDGIALFEHIRYRRHECQRVPLCLRWQPFAKLVWNHEMAPAKPQ